jgi:hypothetical protein
MAQCDFGEFRRGRIDRDLSINRRRDFGLLGGALRDLRGAATEGERGLMLRSAATHRCHRRQYCPSQR